MGFALGCVRLSFDDFCRLYVQEYAAVCEAWNKQQDSQQQADWERTRILAAITIQPHAKKGLTPQKLLPLPWDKKAPGRPAAPKLTKEQQRARFEELKKRLGEE